MEGFLVNIGIFVLLLVWLAVAYVAPLTVASATAVIYLSKFGIAGYYIYWTNNYGYSDVAAIIFVLLCILGDIIIRIYRKK